MNEILLKSLFNQGEMIQEMNPAERPVFAGSLLLALQLMEVEHQELARERSYRLKGQTFGYPPCCVDEFAKDRTRKYGLRRPGPWTGSGFVPCDGCAEEARKDFLKFVSERIMPFRRTTEDFLIRIVEDMPLVPIAKARQLREMGVEVDDVE